MNQPLKRIKRLEPFMPLHPPLKRWAIKGVQRMNNLQIFKTNKLQILKLKLLIIGT